ncbi:MAG: hypothetical protein P4L83_06035 [Nevskia sp.]|nr:hypothetical protein [Nevskia sp.]
MKQAVPFIILAAAGALTGCGSSSGVSPESGTSSSSSSSGGGSSGSSSGGTSATVPGIYCGRFTPASSSGAFTGSSPSTGKAGFGSCLTTGSVFFGLVEESGNAMFGSKNGTGIVVYAPSSALSVSGSAFSVPYTAYGVNGAKANGSATASGTLTGTVSASHSLSGSLSNATAGEGTFTASYSANDWNRAASLTTIAGTYTTSFGAAGKTISPTLTIDSSGTISSTGGCTISGTVSVPDGTHNAYEFKSVVADCAAGSTFNGVGSYFPSGLVNPEGILSKPVIKLGLVDGANTGLFLTLVKK